MVRTASFGKQKRDREREREREREGLREFSFELLLVAEFTKPSLT
jgi:hypothetical protein